MPDSKKKLPSPDEIFNDKGSALPSPGDILGEEVKKKEPTSTPSPLVSPVQSASVGTGSGLDTGELVPSGINYQAGENFTTPAPTPLETPAPDPTQLRAATTGAETTAKDQEQFSPEIQKTGLLLGDKTEAFLRGTGRFANSVLKTPGFAYDLVTAATNEVISDPLGIPRPPTAADIGKSIPEELNVIGSLDDAVKHSEEIYKKKYDKGVSDYFAAGDYSKGFDALGVAIAETAPVTIALMLGNAAGASEASTVFGGGAVFGAEKMSELEKSNPNISQEQKLAVAAANGLMEGAFESFGLTKLGSITKEVFREKGADAAKKVAEEGFKKAYGKVLRQYLGTASTEALTEAATQFSQNVVDKYSGVNPDLDLKTGVVDAAIIGLGAGGSMASPTTALGLVKTRKALKQASTLADQKKALETDLQSENVSAEVKPALSKKIKDINEQEAILAEEELAKYNALPEESKKAVDELLKQSDGIVNAAANETVSDETREVLKKDVDAIDKEIEKIYDDAGKVKEQESADNQAELEYLNEIKDFGFTPEEQARFDELQGNSQQDQQSVVETSNAEKTTPAPKKELSEMTGEEISAYSKELKAQNEDAEAEVFGDRVDEYRAAQKVIGNTASPTKEFEAATKLIDELESALTPEQKEKLFKGTDYREIQAVANKVDVVEQAETIQDLGQALKKPIMDIARTGQNEETKAIVNAAVKKAEELNIKPEELIKESVTQIASEVKDDADARLLAEKALEGIITPKNQTDGKEAPKTEKTKEADVLKADESAQEPVKEPAADSKKQSDAGVVQKMSDDLEAMKQMKTEDLAEKKFIAMIERAWKAKEEGKITRPEYTEFRNKAKDILEGKVKAKDSVDATEAKLRSSAAINKVKEKLLGQGYKKITLSSIVPITPQNIDDLLTLTNSLIHRGIDAGFTVAEATKKALAAIKKLPAYKKLLEAGKIDEKAFESSVNEAMKENKEESAPEKKNTPKPEPKDEGDITGERRKKKTAARRESSEGYKGVMSEMSEDDKYYESIKEKEVEPHINKILDKVQQEGGLESLAKDIIDGKNPFHEKIENVAAFLVGERLAIIAENEGNDIQKSAMNKLAAKLWAQRDQAINVSATQTALENIIAKRLPMSVVGLREYAAAAMSQAHDSYLSQAQRADVEAATKSFTELMESEEGQQAIREAVESELNRIAEATNGKEWVQNLDAAVDGLKIDLSEC